MKIWLVLLLIFLLVGCARPERIINQPVEVDIPVVSRCKVNLPNEPLWNVPHVSPSATVFERAKAITSDLELAKGYIVELQAAARSCS